MLIIIRAQICINPNPPNSKYKIENFSLGFTLACPLYCSLKLNSNISAGIYFINN